MNSYIKLIYSSSVRLIVDKGGSALIEFAVLLPVLCLLVFGVIGFGWTFVLFEAEGRAASSISAEIKNHPGGARTRALAMISVPLSAEQFNQGGNNILCAQAYGTLKQVPAKPADYCSGETWSTSPTDAGVAAGTPYYVAVLMQYRPRIPMPDMYSWMVHFPLTQATVVPMTGTTSTTPPDCTGNNMIQYNNGAWSCVAVPEASEPPNCTGDNMLQYNNGSWSCVPASGNWCGFARLEWETYNGGDPVWSKGATDPVVSCNGQNITSLNGGIVESNCPAGYTLEKLGFTQTGSQYQGKGTVNNGFGTFACVTQ